MRVTNALAVVFALGCGCGSSTVGRAVGPGLVEAEGPVVTFSCAAPEGATDASDTDCEGRDEAAPFYEAVLALAEASHTGEGLAEQYTGPDAPFTQGRLPEPEPHDVTMPVSRIAGLRARDHQTHEAAADEAPEDDETQHAVLRLSGRAQGDGAHVEGLWMTYWGAAEDQFRVGFTAELERTDARWRFARTRTYLAGSYFIGGPGEFDAAHYARLDAEVTAARANLEATPSLERRRLVRDAMLRARQLPGALELARAIATHADATAQDHGALAEIARAAGELDVERRARIAQLAAPMGDVRAFAQQHLDCPNEAPWADYPAMPGDDEVYDESAPEPCMFEELARAHSDAGEPRDVAVIRVTRGFEREEIVELVGAREGRWERLGWVGSGASALEASTRRFEVSDLELRQLVPDGPLEALMRFDARFDASWAEDRAVHVAGYVVCLDLTADDARCARAPTLEEGLRAEGSVARATITFGEGTFTASAVEGPYSRARGERPIESLFSDEDPAPGLEGL